MSLKLMFKGRRPTGRPRTRWFNQVLEDIMKRGRGWQEILKEIFREDRRDWRPLRPSNRIKREES
jgi:hypothetical protein